MVSVAEGIETADDLAFLREIECDVGQGYYIGRPMDVATLQHWIHDWQDRRTDFFRT